MLLRRALHGMATNLIIQYDSIYATLLGANSTQLGSLISAGNAIGALTALPTGWVIDIYSLKGIFLLSTLLLAGSSIIYFIAPHEYGRPCNILLYHVVDG